MTGTLQRTVLLAVAALMLSLTAAGAAYAGSKAIVGTNKADKIEGTDYRDDIYALRGPDKVKGNTGDDDIYGGHGRDSLYGGGDEDYIAGGRGKDTLDGGPKDDTLNAADGRRDYVDGGNGDLDRAYVDKYDVVKNVEIVNGEPVEADRDKDHDHKK